MVRPVVLSFHRIGARLSLGAQDILLVKPAFLQGHSHATTRKRSVSVAATGWWHRVLPAVWLALRILLSAIRPLAALITPFRMEEHHYHHLICCYHLCREMAAPADRAQAGRAAAENGVGRLVDESRECSHVHVQRSKMIHGHFVLSHELTL